MVSTFIRYLSTVALLNSAHTGLAFLNIIGAFFPEPDYTPSMRQLSASLSLAITLYRVLKDQVSIKVLLTTNVFCESRSKYYRVFRDSVTI